MQSRLILSASATAIAVSLGLAPAHAQVPGMCVSGCNIPSPPPPSGPPPPTREQLLRQRDDANQLDALNDGYDALQRHDFPAAIRYFEEALTYSPGDAAITQALASARSQLAHSRRVVPTVIPNVPSDARTAQREAESGCVYDGAGNCTRDRRGIRVDPGPTGPPVRLAGDPVIPRGRENDPRIRNFEAQRSRHRQRAAAIQTELGRLNPATDSARIATLRQERSRAEGQVNFLNFSISETLRAPSQPSTTVQNRNRGRGR